MPENDRSISPVPSETTSWANEVNHALNETAQFIELSALPHATTDTTAASTGGSSGTTTPDSAEAQSEVQDSNRMRSGPSDGRDQHYHRVPPASPRTSRTSTDRPLLQHIDEYGDNGDDDGGRHHLSIQSSSAVDTSFEDPELPNDRATSKPANPESKIPILPRLPFYLRRRILAAFLLSFAILMIVIETLLAVSNQNLGLAKGNVVSHLSARSSGAEILG